MSYKEGIVKTIEGLKDRTGSSMIAIKKIMQSELTSDKKWMNTTFLSALKSLVAAGDLIQVKNSYKLSPDFKKKRAASLKPKPKTKKATSTVSKKKAAPKKKKSAPKKKTAPKKKSAPKKKVTSKKKTTTKSKSKAKPKAKSTKKKTATKKKQ